jgi:hypothetical protein
MPSTLNKEDAKAMIDHLPEGATWDDLMHQIYVRQLIESGQADAKAGRTVPVSAIRARYGLPH